MPGLRTACPHRCPHGEAATERPPAPHRVRPGSPRLWGCCLAIEEASSGRRSEPGGSDSLGPIPLGSCELGSLGLLERDQSASQLEQGEVVARLLRPADQEAAVSVEPGVAGLNDPAACSPVRIAKLLADLVAAAADVAGQPLLGDPFVHPGVVVATIETEPLRPSLARLGPRDRDRGERHG